MPTYLNASCSEVNDIGKSKDCDLITGFHINRFEQLDTGIGIPQGIKLSIKAHIIIKESGSAIIEYKLQNL